MLAFLREQGDINNRQRIPGQTARLSVISQSLETIRGTIVTFEKPT